MIRRDGSAPVETQPLPPDDDPTVTDGGATAAEPDDDLAVTDGGATAAEPDDDPAVTDGGATAAEPDGTDGIDAPSDVGDAYALMWFQRDGELVVTDDVLATVEGITLDDLSLGAGHYPETEAPGQAGNVAFAGHRTTWGRPFHNLDLLEPGDEIHVVDRAGRHWVYDFLKLEVVDPSAVEVVEDGAVPGVSHLLTLTTCNPKYSAATRLIAFGELRGAPAATADGDAAAPADDAGAAPAELASEPVGS